MHAYAHACTMLQVQWFTVSHMGVIENQNLNLQTNCFVAGSSWTTCDVYDPTAASGTWLWLERVYVCWGVFISISHHHIMHRICDLSGCMCVSSCIHAVGAGTCFLVAICCDIKPGRAECELNTDIVMLSSEWSKSVFFSYYYYYCLTRHGQSQNKCTFPL